MHLSRNVKIGAVGVLVTSLALIFILTQINMDLFIDAWRTARYIYVVPTVVFLLLGLLTRAMRWQILLNGALPFIRAFSIMNVAYLVNGVLPLRIGEVARIYLTTRLTRPIAPLTTTSSIIVERILDLFAVVLMMFLALSIGDVPQPLRHAGIVASIMAITGFVILLMMVNRRQWLHRILLKLQAHVPVFQRFAFGDWLNQFLKGIEPITHLPSLLGAVFWTAVSWAFSIIAGYCLMLAFFDEASWSATALYIAAVAFAIALPAVPGNIGTYEASILLALSAMAYPIDGVAIAFAVMVHAVNVAVHALMGIIGFVQEGISLSQLSQGVQKMQHTTRLG